jgi:acyl-coenzyme A synthetase/AMP-(fatty) acid ligase
MMTPLTILKNVAAGPARPDDDFVPGRYTYKDAYAMAAGFQQHVFAKDRPVSLCLCTTDRGKMAAALLAALTRPATLILPYSCEKTVLARIRQEHGFSKAVTDAPADLPPGVAAVDPVPLLDGHRAFDASLIRDPGEVFVRLFTGGSTAAPRTWSKTIGNLFFEAIYHAQKMQVTQQDRFVATVPPCHIYGLLFSVLTPLVAGAGVVEGIPTYPHEIQTAIEKHQATYLVSIPLHYRMATGMDLPASSLAGALCSAARLEPEDSRAFYEKTGLGITEIYGSTETGGIATRVCTTAQPHFTPFDYIQWKQTDGSLAICSDFISPEIALDADGFFVTSDRIRVVGPNAFSLEGRADRIVKVGGKRVDLDEIRMVLLEMPEVSDAAVLSVADSGSRGNEIRALAAAQASAAQIRRHLADRLPGYALPRKIRLTDQIPVSPAGKYDSTQIRKLLDAE